MGEILFEVWRGRTLESVHRGRYAIVSGRRLQAKGGDVARTTFMRSAAKPFQAMTVVTSGAARAFGFEDAEIALMAGSHHGEEVHVRTAASILRKAGLKPAHLQCGIHAPFSVPAQKALARAGREPGVLHNNCSGKHAGMLAAAKAMKAPLATYLAPAHPVQRTTTEIVARYADVKPSKVQIAVDGCSAPTFGLPLAAIARAFAKLADPFIPDDEFRVVQAMMWHPQMVGHPCEELMRALSTELVCKLGAEGVYGAGVIGQGIGVAVKIEDGSSRPLLPALVALLKKLGIFNAAKQARLDALVKTELKNHAGQVVGHVRVRL